MVINSILRVCSIVGAIAVFPEFSAADGEQDYYRIVSISTVRAASDSRARLWRPAPDGLALEVSGLALLPEKRLAVAIRKGEVWILDNVYDEPPSQVTYRNFADGLHEPLGLLWHNNSLYVAQRSELTKMSDTDGDGRADEFLNVADDWGLTGHYHEYAYGPKLDASGNLWITLNIGMGLKGTQLQRTIENPALGFRQARWRGWGMRLEPNGILRPICAGMRSPSGLGANLEGDMFYTDQQGNWVATNSLHHMRLGGFSHHPESLASMNLDNSPIRGITQIPNELPLPEALLQMPQMRPPAIWFPYKKMGQSATDIMLDQSHGRFGPFAGQLFIGEFSLAGMHRVFLERVDGEYQGACFPFRSGFASAVLRLVQGVDGSVFVGLTNRGWSSLGPASYGLQRLVWTGKIPFEIKEMRAQHNGFELTFTQAVEPKSAGNVDSYSMESFTYTYHETYGSDEILKRRLKIQSARVSPDNMRVTLVVDELRPLFVHELVASGVRNSFGKSLLHPQAYYTLNRIPPGD